MPNHFTLIFSAAKGAVYYVAITTVIFSFAKITLFSPRVKISCFYAKAHLVFQWGLNNKRMPLNSSLPNK